MNELKDGELRSVDIVDSYPRCKLCKLKGINKRGFLVLHGMFLCGLHYGKIKDEENRMYSDRLEYAINTVIEEDKKS